MKTHCTALYEEWQMECCGQPFSIGGVVKWDVFAFSKALVDITQIIEHVYDAHYETSDGLLTLQGTVHQINVTYTKYKSSIDNLQFLIPISGLLKSTVEADGDEEEMNGTTFNSYIVVLGDVSIKEAVNKQHTT